MKPHGQAMRILLEARREVCAEMVEAVQRGERKPPQAEGFKRLTGAIETLSKVSA